MVLWMALDFLLFELLLLNMPEWGIILSPHGEDRCSAALNTWLRFDESHFLENWKLNSLRTSSPWMRRQLLYILRFLRKRNHLPVDGIKQLGSIKSTWQVEDFLCDQVLIPTNSHRHSKLSSTNVEQLTMFHTKKGLRLGNIRSKLVQFIVGSDSIVTLTQRNSIVAFCLREAVSHKNTLK